MKRIILILFVQMLLITSSVAQINKPNINKPSSTKPKVEKKVKPNSSNSSTKPSKSGKNNSTNRSNSQTSSSGRRQLPAVIQQLVNDMVYVEGGEFMMGATAEQGSDAESDEKPKHPVRVSSFHIGKYEVTQAQWRAVMGTNPSYFKGDNLPVENVSWHDCIDFIDKLNQLTGKNFRLPTEAEWEYAARGGNRAASQTKYAGNTDIGKVAWYWESIPSKTEGNKGYGTQLVGTKYPNALGIYDMSGNVWEWCQDWYGSDYYSKSPSTNPTGPSSGSLRVGRGGSWFYYAGFCRVSFRFFNTPTFTLYYLGLRLAL